MNRRAAPTRLAFLDAVRGVAALSVAVGHSAETFFPGFLRWSLDWFSPGRAGVCAFFLVSGYVIPISLERAGGLRQFAVSRVFRLYPLYWASLAAVLLLNAAGIDSLPVDFHAELPGAALVNVTMLQELFGVPHAIGLYYTLTIELIWYGACAVLFAVGVLHATERLAWLALAGLAVIGVGAPIVLDRHTPFSTGFYLVTMLVGTAIARHADGELPTSRLAAVIGTAGVVAVAGGWANYRHAPGSVGPDEALGLASALGPWAVAYLVMLLAYAARHRSGGFPRWAVWLGLVSYSVYLLHPVVLDLTVEVGGGPWVRLGVTLAVTVVLAAITQRFIEAPGQALGRRLRSRVPAPA